MICPHPISPGSGEGTRLTPNPLHENGEGGNGAMIQPHPRSLSFGKEREGEGAMIRIPSIPAFPLGGGKGLEE